MTRLHVVPPRVERRVGFTLIEMVIVLSTIGLLAAIAVPRIDFAKFAANTAMQSIGSVLLGAQRTAVTRQHDVIVLFDAPSQAIIVHRDANNDGTVDGTEFERRVPLGEHIVFGRGTAPIHSTTGTNTIGFTKMVRGLPALTFHRNGSASEAAGFYITTQRALNSGMHPKDAKALQVERATGRVSWFKYVDSGWKRGF